MTMRCHATLSVKRLLKDFKGDLHATLSVRRLSKAFKGDFHLSGFFYFLKRLCNNKKGQKNCAVGWMGAALCRSTLSTRRLSKASRGDYLMTDD